MCLISTTTACRWYCKLSNDGGPDAGTVGGLPGEGGCPGGQTCKAYHASVPWLGYCSP
jgi:hypothetical protein